jgi:hypothetical protein
MQVKNSTTIINSVIKQAMPATIINNIDGKKLLVTIKPATAT